MSLKKTRQRNICIMIERLKYCDLSTQHQRFIYINYFGISPYKYVSPNVFTCCGLVEEVIRNI